MIHFDGIIVAVWLLMAVACLASGGDPAITMGCVVAALVIVRTRR